MGSPSLFGGVGFFAGRSFQCCRMTIREGSGALPDGWAFGPRDSVAYHPWRDARDNAAMFPPMDRLIKLRTADGLG